MVIEVKDQEVVKVLHIWHSNSKSVFTMHGHELKAATRDRDITIQL